MDKHKPGCLYLEDERGMVVSACTCQPAPAPLPRKIQEAINNAVPRDGGPGEQWMQSTDKDWNTILSALSAAQAEVEKLQRMYTEGHDHAAATIHRLESDVYRLQAQLAAKGTECEECPQKRDYEAHLLGCADERERLLKIGLVDECDCGGGLWRNARAEAAEARVRELDADNLEKDVHKGPRAGKGGQMDAAAGVGGGGMSTTKRFTIVSSDVHAGGFAIKAREDGIYCLHSDYAAIEAERDALRERCEKLEWLVEVQEFYMYRLRNPGGWSTPGMERGKIGVAWQRRSAANDELRAMYLAATEVKP